MASAKRPTYARIKKTHRFVGEAGGEPYTKKAYTTSCSYDVGVQRASVGIYSLFCFGGGGFGLIHAGIYTIFLTPTHPTFAYHKPKTQRVQCAMIHNSMHTKMAFTGNIQEQFQGAQTNRKGT